LRAHLYAHRLESLYADFCTRFGVKETDFAARDAAATAAVGAGPYLGQREKFAVLLTQTRSALGRYLRAQLKIENEYAYRYQFSDCAFYGANFEAQKDGNRPLDTALYAAVAGAVVQNFLDGFRASNAAAPEWLRYGIAHWYGRRVDARWNQWNAGGSSGDPNTDTSWKWEPRVRGLVQNDAVVAWDDMLKWKSADSIQARDHMIAWSRVDWLFAQKPEQRRAYLYAVTEPLDATGDARLPKQIERELAAYQSIWKRDPAALDKSWRAWVLDKYEK
jgi:hypothetical protein